MNYRYVRYVSLLVLEVAMESRGARFRNVVAAAFGISVSLCEEWFSVDHRSVIEG